MVRLGIPCSILSELAYADPCSVQLAVKCCGWLKYDQFGVSGLSLETCNGEVFHVSFRSKIFFD